MNLKIEVNQNESIDRILNETIYLCGMKNIEYMEFHWCGTHFIVNQHSSVIDMMKRLKEKELPGSLINTIIGIEKF